MSNHLYKFSDKETEKLESRLLYVSEAKYEQDWTGTFHTHHFTEVFYICEGKGFLKVEDQMLPIAEHSMVIVNSDIPHTEISDESDSLIYIVLGIEHLEFQSKNDCGYSIYDFSKNYNEIEFYFRTILKEAKERAADYERVCQNLFQVLICQLTRNMQTKLLVTSSRKVIQECRFIEQYLNEHFKEDISLQTLSELTYLNKYYLAHAFKNYKGTSPINYLIQVRISEAKHLLDTTDYSIAKISSVIGFSSQSYFSQAFRKETGMTPNEYRRTTEKKRGILHELH